MAEHDTVDIATDRAAAAQDLCCSPIGVAVLTDDQASQVASALKALADPIRLRLVSMVANAPSGEVCACDLPELLGRSQPTISHHLAQLVEADVLRREKRGKWAWYTLDRDRLSALCAVLTAPPATANGARS